MRIPDSVKVGAKTYVVKRVNHPLVLGGRECYGVIDYDTQEIAIRTDDVSEQTVANTFFHELVHALTRERMIDWGERNEEYTESLAKGLHAFFVDNGIDFGRTVTLDDGRVIASPPRTR